MPLPAGGEPGRRNKKTIIDFIKNIESDDERPAYDSIHSFYGIVDDDNDRLIEDLQGHRNIMNLFVLNRYAKENYILDPINIYFYLRSIPDGKVPEKLKDLLVNVKEELTKRQTNDTSEELLKYSFKKIYQEIKKPEKKEGIKDLLQAIVDSVKNHVFGILFPNNSQEAESKIFYGIIKPVIIKWLLNTNSLALKQFKVECDNWKDIKSENDIQDLQKQIEESIKGEWKPQNTKDEKILDYIKEIIRILTKLKNEELVTEIKEEIEKAEIVKVFGIELEYPKLFTCLRGHDLEELYACGIFNNEKRKKSKKYEICDKIIKELHQTGNGIFIPDEVINIYKAISQNVIHLANKNFKELEKYKKQKWFILYYSIDKSQDNEKNENELRDKFVR